MEKTKATRKPPTPLKTSALQQDANNTLGFSAKQTLTFGTKALRNRPHHLLCVRDSINLAEVLTETQSFLLQAYGQEYATGAVRYKTTAKGAQEAHEAIRPTDVAATPDSLKAELEPGQWKLYNLIWRRTVASQMPIATIERTAVDIKAGNNILRANGSIVVLTAS